MSISWWFLPKQWLPGATICLHRYYEQGIQHKSSPHKPLLLQCCQVKEIHWTDSDLAKVSMWPIFLEKSWWGLVCPSCPKPRLITFVKHSPRSDLSGGQMPENPEEEDASSGALQRICSPKSGRRYWIKGSVLRQQIWALWGSHGMCSILFSPAVSILFPLRKESFVFGLVWRLW